MKRVAIQGFPGAYHEIAARKYFEDEELEIVACLTFRDIFAESKKDPTLIAVMAIENTIAGGLLQNHNLLKVNNLKIGGEYKLHISHTLSALPGQRIGDIKEIISHPMALMQCSDFLDSLTGVKIVEHDDTALAAKEISEKKLKGEAAICSAYAAEMYGLQPLATSIETNKRNFTRFLILAHEKRLPAIRKNTPINKSSLVFILPHSEGSLSKVLAVLSFYGINLTRIQSLPIVGREWEYQFYVDLAFADYNRYRQSLDAIRPLAAQLKILGEYVEDKQIRS